MGIFHFKFELRLKAIVPYRKDIRELKKNKERITAQIKVDNRHPKTTPVEILGRSIPMNPPVNAPMTISTVAIT